MRLFTTLLVALLSILGGCNLKAQVAVSYESTPTTANEITTGYYVIKAKYKTIDPCYLYITGNQGKFSAEVETSSFKNVWSVEVNSDNSFYLRNVATGQYLKFGTNTKLGISNTKSGGSTFSATSDYQVSGNITRLSEQSYVLYQGAPTTTEQRQVIHADGSNISGLTMSSWITNPQANIGTGSAIGQFEFYKIKETNGATPTVGNANCLYYLMNANGQYLSGERTGSNDGGATTSQNSNTNAYKFIVNRSSNGQNYYINVYDKSGNKILNAGGNYLWRMGYDTPNSDQGNKEYWLIKPIEGLNAFSIKNVEKNSYLVATGNGNAVGFAGSANTNGTWYFLPANEAATTARDLTVTIKEGDNVHGNVATFSASYPVSVPEGCTAYTATFDETNNVINMTELESNVIPANTGVLIKYETTGDVAMKPTLEAGTEVTNNRFSAVGDAEYTFDDKENVYLLGKANGELCFRLMNNEGTQTIGAHKAYIKLDNSIEAASLQINFGGNVTSVNNAVVNKANSKRVYYDLFGRRVAQPQHGLYIVNGKKVIIK